MSQQPPQVNIVVLIKRTLEKVFSIANFPETPEMIRTVATCLIRVAADYTRTLGDDAEPIEALFHAFLTGDEDAQRAAVKTFGEASALKPDKPTEEPKPEVQKTDET
jgi:hypothetical protein